jgi:hypothetical protein
VGSTDQERSGIDFEVLRRASGTDDGKRQQTFDSVVAVGIAGHERTANFDMRERPDWQ